MPIGMRMQQLNYKYLYWYLRLPSYPWYCTHLGGKSSSVSSRVRMARSFGALESFFARRVFGRTRLKRYALLLFYFLCPFPSHGQMGLHMCLGIAVDHTIAQISLGQCYLRSSCTT
jgi:hypothetical protein